MTAPNPQASGQHESPEQRKERYERTLGMAHLQDAKQQVQQTTVPQKDPKELARLNELYSFTFDWTDARGRRYHGQFTNKVLTIGEKKLVGAMRARAAGNAPVEALLSHTVDLIYVTTWMEISLQDRPAWFKNIEQLHDENLVYRVWQEVTAHEDTFHGRDQSAAAGAPAGR